MGCTGAIPYRFFQQETAKPGQCAGKTCHPATPPAGVTCRWRMPVIGRKLSRIAALPPTRHPLRHATPLRLPIARFSRKPARVAGPFQQRINARTVPIRQEEFATPSPHRFRVACVRLRLRLSYSILMEKGGWTRCWVTAGDLFSSLNYNQVRKAQRIRRLTNLSTRFYKIFVDFLREGFCSTVHPALPHPISCPCVRHLK